LVRVSLSCDLHPKYQAKRIETAECTACEYIYWIIKDKQIDCGPTITVKRLKDE
jgi:hypothetical protein